MFNNSTERSRKEGFRRPYRGSEIPVGRVDTVHLHHDRHRRYVTPVNGVLNNGRRLFAISVNVTSLFGSATNTRARLLILAQAFRGRIIENGSTDTD